LFAKRTFTTKLEPVDAFGLANELLRPRGFTLGNGNPPRNQSWRRGDDSGKKSRSIFKAPQTIEVEFDRGRVNVTATANVSGKKSTKAQGMMAGYAEALERLMSLGEKPAVAGRAAKRAEAAIKKAAMRRSLSVCIILLGVFGGGGYVLTTMKDKIPSPMKWFSGSGKFADGKPKKSGSAPVVVVRKAGAQTSATPKDQNP
jgi:hypothetical protein